MISKLRVQVLYDLWCSSDFRGFNKNTIRRSSWSALGSRPQILLLRIQEHPLWSQNQFTTNNDRLFVNIKLQPRRGWIQKWSHWSGNGTPHDLGRWTDEKLWIQLVVRQPESLDETKQVLQSRPLVACGFFWHSAIKSCSSQHLWRCSIMGLLRGRCEPTLNATQHVRKPYHEEFGNPVYKCQFQHANNITKLSAVLFIYPNIKLQITSFPVVGAPWTHSTDGRATHSR